MRNFAIFLVVLLLTVGCAPVNSSLATSTETTSGVQIKLITSTQPVTKSVSPSPKPNLARPATTITPPTPTLTPTRNSTPALTSTGPTPTPGLYVQALFSPDHRFIAKLYDEYTYPTGISTIEVLDDTGTLLWAIPYQGEILSGHPRPSLQLYKWSGDSSRLYFYYAFYPDGALTLWQGFDLQTIAVNTGDVQLVLPGEGLIAFSISADERYLAYSRDQDQPRRLIIRDLVEGTERSTPIDPKSEGAPQVGWISWSPGGDKLLVHTQQRAGIQAIVVDVSTLKQISLFRFLAESYWFMGWSQGSVQYLTYPENEVILVDVETGDTTRIGTATPWP